MDFGSPSFSGGGGFCAKTLTYCETYAGNVWILGWTGRLAEGASLRGGGRRLAMSEPAVGRDGFCIKVGRIWLGVELLDDKERLPTESGDPAVLPTAVTSPSESSKNTSALTSSETGDSFGENRKSSSLNLCGVFSFWFCGEILRDVRPWMHLMQMKGFLSFGRLTQAG